MILEEFISYYHKNKDRRIQSRELLVCWLKRELNNIPQKNYQKILHSELMVTIDGRILPKNKQGQSLLNSLLRITNILEEKKFESWLNDIKPKDFLHV